VRLNLWQIKAHTASQGEFVLFTSADSQTRLECRFESDTLLLSQAAKQTVVQASYVELMKQNSSMNE
jgi:hypothetical protein